MGGIGALIGGVAGSFIWVNIGKYVHKTCHAYHKED